MGKRDKEHRKKVAKRNENIKQAQKVYQKMYNDMLKQKIEEIRAENPENKTNESPFTEQE